MNQTGKGLFAGLLYAFSILTLSVVIISLLLMWTNVKEASLSIYSLFIHIVALLTGGFTAGKRSGTKGWLHGGILGICYAIFVFITGFLAFQAGFDQGKMLLLIGAFAVGAVGGMIGVQFRN